MQWVCSHHERLDGCGYPDGLAAENIPDGALLIGIADAYHAITSDSNHRRGRSPHEALTEIRAHAGTQFEPRLVDALEGLELTTIISDEASERARAYIDPVRSDEELRA